MTARKLSGVIPMISKERDELRRTLGRRLAAESALESARAATNRARDLVEEITRQVEDAAHSEHQRKADGAETVEGADREAVDEDLKREHRN